MEGRPDTTQYFQSLSTIAESPDLEVMPPFVKAWVGGYAIHSQ